MSDQEFLEDQRAFYGEADIRLCPRCDRGEFQGSSERSRCNHCCGAGIVHEDGGLVE